MGAKSKVGAPPGASQLFRLVAFAMTVTAIYVAQDILLPFALAMLLAFVLAPLAHWLNRVGLGWTPSVLVAVGAAMVVVVAVGWMVTVQIVDLGAKLPDYKDNLIRRVRTLGGSTGKLQEATETIEEIGKELQKVGQDESDDEQEAPDEPPDAMAKKSWTQPDPAAPLAPQLGTNLPTRDGEAVEVKVVELPPSPLDQIRNWLGPLLGPITTASIVLVLVIFFLLDREALRNRLIQLIGAAHLQATTEALTDTASRLSRFLRAQLLINSLYGVGVATGLYLIGVPNALLWGALGLALRFFPYVGPWIVGSIPILLSLAVFDDWLHPLLTIALLLTLEVIVNTILEPWLYGASVGVSSIGVIAAVVFWTWMWGPVGLVLAMPLTVCMVVIGKHIPELRFLFILFGDGSSLPIEERMYQRLLSLDEEEPARLAEQYVKDHDLTAFYDEVLIPTLRLSEQDRHAGRLNEGQEEFVIAAAGDLSEDLFILHLQKMDADEAARIAEGRCDRGRVLCIPVGDPADELAARLLTQLLRNAGYEVELGSTDTLVGEWVQRVQDNPPDVVVISALPPLAMRDGRYLCKRLRSALPEMPIIAGHWSGRATDQASERLREAGATAVASTFEECMHRVHSAAITRQEA